MDEIGDMPLGLQSKLLRIIQEKEFERVGGSSIIKTDVRILAATNKILMDEVNKGNFRLDLFYRFNVFNIFLPPLMARKDDISLLAEHILKRFKGEYGLNKKFNRQVFSRLMGCDFPGNIRELENCIERAYFNTDSDTILPEDFSCGLCSPSLPLSSDIKMESVHEKPLENHEKAEEAVPIYEELSEKDKIVETLKSCGWVQAKAARILNISVRQLNYRISKYGIQIKKI